MLQKAIGLVLLGVLLFAGFLLALVAALTGEEIETQNQKICATSSTIISPVAVNADGSGVTIVGDVITIDGITLNREQLDNAEIILGIALSRGLTEREAAIGVATAMQESDLYNINYGHLDSFGLFQQRPSQGWGTEEQIMDPVYATNKFFDAMLRVWNRDTKTMIQIAIETQKPDAFLYKLRWKWDTMALTLAANAYGSVSDVPIEQLIQPVVGCSGVGGNVGVAIEVAKSQIGVPYEWGASEEGVGFDCSGLMRYAYGKAGVNLVGNSAAIYTAGVKIAREDVIPGDLVFWDDGSRLGVTTHVAMYLGNEQIIEATTYGSAVKISPMRWDNTYVGATRPVPEPTDFEPGDSVWASPFGSASYPITSNFGMRTDPIGHVIYRLHAGTDFGAGYGVPVYAVSGGEVVFAKFDGGRGNQVRIQHGGGIASVSAHLQGFAPSIQLGVTVKTGDLIGYVGSSGRSLAPHLHLEIREGGQYGTPIDPIPFLGDKGVRP